MSPVFREGATPHDRVCKKCGEPLRDHGEAYVRDDTTDEVEEVKVCPAGAGGGRSHNG